MLLTHFNIYIRKYSCRWILNIMHQPYEVNATYLSCILYIIGDYKKLIDDIMFQLIINLDAVCSHLFRLWSVGIKKYGHQGNSNKRLVCICTSIASKSYPFPIFNFCEHVFNYMPLFV